MWSVYKRMAQLTSKKELNEDEQKELNICLKANQKLVEKLVSLENLSIAASLTEDTEWQHEICAGIEEIHNKLIGLPIHK